MELEKNAELLFILESLGVLELISIYDNPEEVHQLLNKIGRPELFQECIDEIQNKKDEDYVPPSSESESETEEEAYNEMINVIKGDDDFYYIE